MQINLKANKESGERHESMSERMNDGKKERHKLRDQPTVRTSNKTFIFKI